MKLIYIRAKQTDADLLIDLYNKSFYDDFIKYGECPAYGKTSEQMEKSIENFPKEIIICDRTPVGVISAENKGNGNYYIGCLCVIPKYQNKGIGTRAVSHLKQILWDWKHIELITPADKEENIYFYTQKCGFKIINSMMDGNVKVVCLALDR